MNFYILTLGCPRNEVAGDHIIRKLSEEHQSVGKIGEADLVIINTCGFIESAKEQSIAAIIQAANDKKDNALLAVVGCLVQRYMQELAVEIPEIDILIGIERFDEFSDAIRKAAGGVRYISENTVDQSYRPIRSYSTRKISVYLQITDGCDERCPFCAIPLIRGGFRSRAIADVASEARSLLSAGAKELVLVGQDIAGYGRGTQDSLSDLLRLLDSQDGEFWVRCMYVQPYKINDELISVIAESKHICRYLDLPIQHGSTKLLRSMGRLRGGLKSADDYLKLIYRLRDMIPTVALRSTFMIGYPGESEADFSDLCEFIKKAQLDFAGFFTYSPQDGTAAAGLRIDVDADISAHRLREASDLQSEISFDKISGTLGQELTVLIEKYDDESDLHIGRSEHQAPEIDGAVILRGLRGKHSEIGRFEKAKVVEAEDFDLICEAGR